MSRTANVPSQIDIDVGARIRARRKLLGLSQSALAERLGITFQQVQKYEKGSNRVGSSRLQHIAQILGTSPSALFGEEPDSDAKSIPELGLVEALVGTADGIALNKAFVNIQDPRLRKAIIALVRTIADDNSAE